MSPHCRKTRIYKTFNFPGSLPGSKTLLTGIRQINKNNYVITGFYEYPESAFSTISFVFKGKLNGNGKWYILNYPSSPDITVEQTNLYGPDVVHNHCNGTITYNVVGNYTKVDVTSTYGALYQGLLNGIGKWTTIVPTPLSSDPILGTICHSTMGNLVVGNYNTLLIQGKAFIYDIKTGIYTDIVKPQAISVTAYGIWKNKNCEHNYTIAGGFFNVPGAEGAYLVDWDNKKKKFSNWTNFNFNNDAVRSIATHFDGISGNDNDNVYTLTGVYVDIEHPLSPQAFFACVNRKCHSRRFNPVAHWKTLSFPNSTGTSGNSVSEDVVIGVYNSGDDQGTVNGYISLID